MAVWASVMEKARCLYIENLPRPRRTWKTSEHNYGKLSFKSSTFNPHKVALCPRCLIEAFLMWIFFWLPSSILKSHDWMHTFKKSVLWWKSEFWRSKSERHWEDTQLHPLRMGREPLSDADAEHDNSQEAPMECPSCWEFGPTARGPGSLLEMAPSEGLPCVRPCVKHVVHVYHHTVTPPSG